MNYYESSLRSYNLEELSTNEEYNFFLTLRVTTTATREEDHYYFFRILDEETIEFFVANHYESSKQSYTSIVQMELSNPLRKQTMINYLKDLLESSWNIFGPTKSLVESPLITKEEFNQIMDDIATDLTLNKYIGNNKWKDSPVIQLCQENGLMIESTTYSDYTFFCSCPTGYSHNLIIRANTGAWSCASCRQEGYLEELGKFIIMCREGEKQHHTRIKYPPMKISNEVRNIFNLYINKR